jgi:hypothetical protein
VCCMLISRMMLTMIGKRRQGEFNFLISQDAWLAGQGIVISAYSLKGSVPSKHHVVPLSSADADSGADYTEITILVPELAARPSSPSSTSSSRYDVGSGDLSPCDADDAVSTSSGVAAVADGADDAVHDGVHGQLAAAGDHMQQQSSDNISSSSDETADTHDTAVENSNDDMCKWDYSLRFSLNVTAMRQAVLHSVAANCNNLKNSVHQLWTRACAAATSQVAIVKIKSVEHFTRALSSVQTAATKIQQAVQLQLHSIATAVINSVKTHSSVQQCALASIASICSIVQRVHQLEICSSGMQSTYQCTTGDTVTVSMLLISTVLLLIGLQLAAKRCNRKRKAAAVVSTTVTVHQNAINDTNQQEQQQQQRRRVHTTAAASRSNGSTSGGLGLNSIMMMLDDELAGTALVACDSAEQRLHNNSSSSSSTRANRHPFS